MAHGMWLMLRGGGQPVTAHRLAEMPSSRERVAGTDIAFWRRREGDVAVVFVHGFLDDHRVWHSVIADLETPRVETVQLDLAGMGTRSRARGPFTYDRFAADVIAVVDALNKPFLIAGHSMGAAIAELVAAARPEQALGLVLLAPVPLGGMRLPEEAVEEFRSLGRDPNAQRGARRRLSQALPLSDLRRLVRIGVAVRRDVVRAVVDCWNAGLADGAQTSRFTGPVLILRGGDDGFITADVVAEVSPRFGSVELAAIDGTGHWPHLERPSAVAARIDRFLTETATDRRANTASGVRPGGWTHAFAEKSGAAFAAALANDVVLEASVMRDPVEGRDAVMRVMGIASQIYESLVFTHESGNGSRSYLEWEATAFGGLVIRGVTVLTTDHAGRIVHAAIHHRPLDAALRFSQEMRDRAGRAIDPDHFYDGHGDRSSRSV